MKILDYASICYYQTLIDVFSDQTNETNSILAKYKPDLDDMLGDVGTLATILWIWSENDVRKNWESE